MPCQGMQNVHAQPRTHTPSCARTRRSRTPRAHLQPCVLGMALAPGLYELSGDAPVPPVGLLRPLPLLANVQFLCIERVDETAAALGVSLCS